jgi:DNA-binding beta-propeller fold protein YncE
MPLTTLAKNRTYTYSHCLGSLFAWTGPNDMALGETIGQKNTIYVVSRGSDPGSQFGAGQRWTKWDTEKDVLIKDTGSPGDADEQFLWPSSIALDKNGDVYVADEYLNRVTVFSNDGKYLRKWSAAGRGSGQLDGPAGIRFDADGNLYIAESRNHRVQKLSKDGKFIAMWGESGSGPGQLNLPAGLHIDSEGNLFVADWGNNRVQKFTPDGRLLTQFGASSPGALKHPTGVVTDKDGDVYVADWGNNRVNVYDPGGEYLTSFYGDARELSKSASVFVSANPDFVKARRRADTSIEWTFRRPTAVAVDSQNRLLVIESISGRIQFYQKDDSYVDPQFNL